jgi:hypothetical protein
MKIVAHFAKEWVVQFRPKYSLFSTRYFSWRSGKLYIRYNLLRDFFGNHHTKELGVVDLFQNKSYPKSYTNILLAETLKNTSPKGATIELKSGIIKSCRAIRLVSERSVTASTYTAAYRIGVICRLPSAWVLGSR